MDFKFHESLSELEPVSETAQDWIDTYFETEPHHWQGNRLRLNSKHSETILETLKAQGFTVCY